MVRTGEGGFLSHHLRGRVLQDYVIWEGAYRPWDCVGVEGADGFFVRVGGDYAILHVMFYMLDEKGLESIFNVSDAWWGSDKVVR